MAQIRGFLMFYQIFLFTAPLEGAMLEML